MIRAQIVVMVTKAVSDQFGGGGIADQMIRFNGYPLLENHDHAFGVPGALNLHFFRFSFRSSRCR